MKYLKEFNESNILDIDIINDILLDVSDEGYESKVRSTNVKTGGIFSKQIEIEIFNREKENFYEDVIETVERLKDYIESENYILAFIEANLTHKKYFTTKIENFKGSRMMSNFKSFQPFNSLYEINGVILVFITPERFTYIQ